MKEKKAELKLVEVHGESLNTTSLVMAEMCGVKHKATIQLIRRYENDLKEIGRVTFEMRSFDTKGGVQEQEIALLDDYAAILLMTHMRSNEKVALFKKNLVKEFKRIRNLLSEPGRKETIKEKKAAHAPMMYMLECVREELEKETQEKDYRNENLFCNRALNGKWEPIPDEKDLDVYDLRLLKAIRMHNTVLLSRYPGQKPERKEAMEQFVIEYKIKHPRLKLVE